MPQPVDARTVGLVVAGGAVGVLARAALLAPVADPGVVPWVTLGVNAVGSLLLGLLLGLVDGRRPRVRAFLGTGVLGGFTTYSAFAVETAAWLATPWLAAGLAAASLLAGVAGAVAGLALGRRIGGDARGALPPEVAE
jgi:CrcB protein